MSGPIVDITVRPRGPDLIRGPVVLHDPEGG
jgi:hypothetical protein